jgi:hypothetical protein
MQGVGVVWLKVDIMIGNVHNFDLNRFISPPTLLSDSRIDGTLTHLWNMTSAPKLVLI